MIEILPGEIPVTLEVAVEKLAEERMQAKREFFYIEFIKRSTGELRKMKCRFGVFKALKERLDTAPRRDPRTNRLAEHELLTVFEPGVGNRDVPLENLLRLHLRGMMYVIPENIARLQPASKDPEEQFSQEIQPAALPAVQSNAETASPLAQTQTPPTQARAAKAVSASRPSKAKRKRRK